MVATPARIALSTNDGVVLSKVDPTILANHPNAGSDDDEIESFFDTAANAQTMLDELEIVGRPRSRAAGTRQQFRPRHHRCGHARRPQDHDHG